MGNDIDRRTLLKGMAIAGAGAAVLPLEALANRHRAVGRNPSAAIIADDAVQDRPERTYNSLFLAQLADNFRGEVWRKRDDAYANHPPRTNNWKWGHRLQIFDFGCNNYHLQLINEFDDECPDPNNPAAFKQNPQRRLNTHMYVTPADRQADPVLRWYRLDDESALVSNLSDDDFMKIYNTRVNSFQIDNLRADSSVGVPGVGNITEMMDRYQQTNDLAALGLDASAQVPRSLNQEHMRLFTKALQGANDPWTITVVGQATDLGGNPLSDVYAATAYLVEMDGNGSMGEPSRLYKTIGAIIDWKAGFMERTFLDTSKHGNPEIALGVPYFNSQDDLEFKYGETNKFKVDPFNARTDVDLEKLRDAWMYVKPHNPGRNDYRS